MDAIEASTVVYVPRREVFEFIQGYSGATEYADHVERVRQFGDGGPGTDYRITVSWWRFDYTAVTRVTDVDPPTRIDWRSTKRPEATGSWHIESVDPPADPPPDVDPETATELRLRIEFDPESVLGARLSGPLPVEAVLDRVKPVVVSESEAAVAALVADLEGRRREVDLTVHRAPRSL
ncbi:SRPBCC family protein [Halorarius halobius]|uniref:SRPBCC family protein n=1 Tax=Halorarius halobius TaxID=2962671 RepID=UPI0020CFB423|nr:SRPBCC family protein [Halorarius halobius]